MANFTCKCGLTIADDEETGGASGLLKPLTQQVALEAFQAEELAKLVSTSPDERKRWQSAHFGPEYPSEVELQELIEGFLYFSHRKDGCTATFNCPKCGRLALLHDVNDEWQFFLADNL